MGREMLELEAEILQQQQKERGDWQPQAGGNVRNKQHKFPGAQIAEGNRACSNPPGSLLWTPRKQVAHRVQFLLGLETTGTNEGRHLAMEARNNLRRSARGEEARRQRGAKVWKEEDECRKVTAECGSALYEA